jgi:hypothetical protein
MIRMLLRAAFWIGLVALLMPRDPQLHPPPDIDCRRQPALCAISHIFGAFRDSALRSLAQIKADIEAEQNARAASGG